MLGRILLIWMFATSAAMAQSLPTPTYGNVYVNAGVGSASTKIPVGLTVNNNSSLTALPSTTVPTGYGVMRLGYTTAGDAPPVVYTAQASCPYNGGSADGGSCVSTSDSKFWVADLPTVLDLRIFGADMTATNDATSALNNCLTVAANSGKGGQCVLPQTGSIYLASSVTLQNGTSLTCQADNYGWPSIATSGSIFNSMSQIKLGSSATINGNNSTGIRGCMIVPNGMTFPQTSSGSWAGTAVALPASTSHYNDFSLENVLIMGFDTCFTSAGTTESRFKFKNVNLDCNSGMLVGAVDDNSNFDNIHVWPWATVAAVNAGSVTPLAGFPRSGKGISFSGALEDGAHLTGMSLSYGHTVNLFVDGSNVTVENFWSDSPNGVSAAAYGVYVTSNGTGFTADTIYTAGQGFGSNNIEAMLIDAPLAQLGNVYLNGSYLVNCLGVGATVAAHVQIANLQVTNCSIGGSLAYIAIGNSSSVLNVSSFNITTGASGGSRSYDLAIPAGMNSSQISFKSGYSDIGNNKINIGGNALAYQTWSPTVSCGSGTITTLGTVTAKYNNIDGKTAWVNVSIPITTVGSCSGSVNFTTPWTFNQFAVPIAGRRDGVGGDALICETQGSSTSMDCFTYNNSSPAASGATLNIAGVVPTQ